MIMERLKIGKVVKLDGFSIIIEVIEENISENINFKIGIPISPIMINKLLSIKLLTGKQIICKIDKIYDKNFFHVSLLTFVCTVVSLRVSLCLI